MADEEYQQLVALIKSEVSGRYVYSLDANPITYVVREFRQNSKFQHLNLYIANEIILKRLFDQNNILLDDNVTTFNLVSTNENTFFTNYHMYAIEEENALKEEILHSKDHVFTVKYQLFPDEEGELECIPVEIYP